MTGRRLSARDRRPRGRSPAIGGLCSPERVSRRPREWNNSRLVKGNVAEEVARLKQQPGKDLALFGSADLASTFMRFAVIYEYRIFVTPVVLGDGNPMFKDVKDRTHLRLSRTETLSSGVVILY